MAATNSTKHDQGTCLTYPFMLASQSGQVQGVVVTCTVAVVRPRCDTMRNSWKSFWERLDSLESMR